MMMIHVFLVTLIIIIITINSSSTAIANNDLHGIPIVTWSSQPVIRNETVLAYGENLNDVTSVKICSHTSGECHTVIPLQTWRFSTKFVIPTSLAFIADIWSFYLCSYKHACTLSSMKLNVPQVWWIQSEYDGISLNAKTASIFHVTSSSTLRILGLNLAWNASQCISAAYPISSSYVSALLVPILHYQHHNEHTTIKLDVLTASCYDLTLRIPANAHVGNYTLHLNNGLGKELYESIGIKISIDTLTLRPKAVVKPLGYTGDDIQNALNSVAKVGGGIVLLEAAIYKISGVSTLSIPTFCTLQGVSMNTTKLRWPSIIKTSLTALITGPLGGNFDLSDFTIEAPRGFLNIIADGGPTALGANFIRLRLITPSNNSLPIRAAFYMRGDDWTLRDSLIIHRGNCNSTFPRATVLDVQGSHDVLIKNNTMFYGCDLYDFEATRNVIFEANNIIGDGSWLSGGNSVSTYGKSSNENFFFGRNTERDNPAATVFHETLTLDGAGGAYFGPIDSIEGRELTLSSSPTFKPPTHSNWIGAVIVVMNGTAMGQWRRVAAHDDRRWTIVEPFSEGATPGCNSESFISIVPFRGRIIVAGNHFSDGNVVQMYGSSYDSVIADNVALSCNGGFNSWGRNLHSDGWQPSNFVQFLRNTLVNSKSLSSKTTNETPEFVSYMNHCHVHRNNVLINGTKLEVKGTSSDVLLDGNHINRSDIILDKSIDHVLLRGNGL